MTDEQIENWRRVLCGMIGPYALIMPKESIVRFRDKMQSAVNAIPLCVECGEVAEPTTENGEPEKDADNNPLCKKYADSLRA